MDNPERLELFNTIIKYAKNGDWISLSVYFFVFYVPAAFAWITTWFANRKVEGLYKERLNDKDKEIQRQSDRIKDLENTILTRRRK